MPEERVSPCCNDHVIAAFQFDFLGAEVKISSAAEGNVLEAINLAINGRGGPLIISCSLVSLSAQCLTKDTSTVTSC